MPKRPPRLRKEVPVPKDLATPLKGPRLAWNALEHSSATETTGRIWQSDVLDFLSAMEAESVDLVVADPPYAIAKDKWDEFESLESYTDWCDSWLTHVERVLKPTGSAYICGFSEILARVMVTSADRFKGGCRWLVWHYRNKANLGSDWGRSHESILHLKASKSAKLDVDSVRVPYNNHTKKYPVRIQAVTSQYGKGKRRDKWTPHPLGAKPRDVFEIPVLCNGTGERTGHPTQKPEQLIEKFIKASSPPGGLVIDPFLGSGTTAIVAAKLGRRFEVADRDPRYVGMARERLNAWIASSQPAAQTVG